MRPAQPSRRRRDITPAEIRRAVDARDDGIPFYEIARRFGISKSVLSLVFREAREPQQRAG